MSWGITLLLALAISLDGLGVGFSYGLRRLKLPWVSLILIALISTTVSFASLAVGKLSSLLFKPVLVQRLGALLLLILGFEMILEAYLKARGEELEANHILLKVRVPRLGVAIAVLQEPHRADRDCSGSISPGEALTLGLALALDALGTGVGAGATGFSLWLTPLLIGLCQFLMVEVGVVIGRRWQWRGWNKKGAVLPGVILIAIGLWRM